MIFEQIDMGNDNNFAYLIADEASREAAVVDPSYHPEKVLARAKKLNLEIKFLINTHGHYDHVDGNDYVLSHTKAKLIGAQMRDGDEIKLGDLVLKIIATPGHTADSICILVENKLLTGDTLFVNDVGRTWSEQDTRTEFESLKKLMLLDDKIEIYPGHNYGAMPFSTIGYEKSHNPCLIDIANNDLAGFVADK